MKRVWIGIGVALILAAAVGGGLWCFRAPIAIAAMRQVYRQAMSHDPLADLPDGLHLGLCGSGSPMPDPTRAGPCRSSRRSAWRSYARS